ncbi:MAG: DMT family transporter [Caldilineae bacterium]|nr:MAG: DMT family transporter [Caldilineae bacterium]
MIYLSNLRRRLAVPRVQGILYTFASAAFLSVTFIASKEALRELPTLGFTPIWFTLASAWGIGYYAVQPNKVPWQTLKPYLGALLLLGLSSSASNFFFFSSIRLGEPTMVAFFSRSETVFSLLWGVVALRERLTRPQWLGVAMAVVGAGVMTYQGGRLVWTVLGLALVANFFNATTSYVAKRNVASVPPAVLGIARTLVLAASMGVLGLAWGQLRWPSLRALLWMAGGSFFGPFLSYLLFYKGLRTMDMGQAAIIRATQPLFVALYSLLLFGRTLGGVQFAGGLVILAGVTLMLSNGVPVQISSLVNPLLMYRRRRNHNPFAERKRK